MYKTLSEEKQELIMRFLILIAGIIVLLFVGMIWFHFSEGWDLKASLYYAGISLMSRGFSDTYPQTWAGVLFSLFYTLIGLGFVIYYCTSLISFFVAYYEKGVKRGFSNVFEKFKDKRDKKKSNTWVSMDSIKDK